MVNIGQVSKTFPSTTPFLKGSIFGRLTADLVRGIAASALVLLVGIALGARIESGPAGAVLIVLLSSRCCS